MIDEDKFNEFEAGEYNNIFYYAQILRGYYKSTNDFKEKLEKGSTNK
ncbi:MAG: hypothetical protein MJ252_11590 [archaeon]|nr:hypothetical protein [archaeon]